jgi:RimJ/RimL family protein N-acetyltransferase
VRLQQVTDRSRRDAILAGDVGDLDAAPGWPHEDTKPGMSFLDSGGLVFLILDDADRVAGECGTKTPPDSAGTVEVGYGLAAQSRGRGLGGAAVAELVARLRREPGVRAIEAEVHIDNEPSRRILQRLGFDRIGEPHGGYARYILRVTKTAEG